MKNQKLKIKNEDTLRYRFRIIRMDPELDKYITGSLTAVVGFWLVVNLILTAVALFKHYR